MRFLADIALVHVAVGGVESVHHIVETARQPEIFPIDTYIAHVGTVSTRDGPVGDHFVGGEIDYAHAALAFALAVDTVDAAVCHIGVQWNECREFLVYRRGNSFSSIADVHGPRSHD